MKQRRLPLGYLLAVPVLIVLAVLAYTYPAKLLKQEMVKLTPSPVSISTGGPTALLAVSTIIETSTGGTSVTVSAATVNIRFADHSATGLTVSKGVELEVIWMDDGYGRIVGSGYDGFYIWRGCTSDPAKYSCVTANR